MKLTDEAMQKLHDIEAKYGSVIFCPNRELNALRKLIPEASVKNITIQSDQTSQKAWLKKAIPFLRQGCNVSQTAVSIGSYSPYVSKLLAKYGISTVPPLTVRIMDDAGDWHYFTSAKAAAAYAYVDRVTLDRWINIDKLGYQYGNWHNTKGFLVLEEQISKIDWGEETL